MWLEETWERDGIAGFADGEQAAHAKNVSSLEIGKSKKTFILPGNLQKGMQAGQQFHFSRLWPRSEFWPTDNKRVFFKPLSLC